MDRRWAGYVAGVTAVVALWSFLPTGAPRDVTFLVVGAIGVVATVLGVRVHRPRAPVAWYLLAAGLLLLVAGDVVYTWYLDVLHVEPYPSPADWVYLAAYPVLVAGLVRLVRERRVGRDLAGLVDALIVAAAVGVVGWVFIAEAFTTAPTTVERVLTLAYPAADVVLVAVLVRLVSAPGRRPLAFRLVVASMLSLFAADVLYTIATSTDQTDTTWSDLMFLASYGLLGAAAMHPSMRGLSEPAPAERRLSRRRMIGLAAAVLVAPLLESAELVTGIRVDGWPVKVANLLLVSLTLVRLYLAVIEARQEADRRVQVQDVLAHEVAHDPLTGIANRATVLEEAAVALDAAGAERDGVGLLLVSLDHFRAVNDRYGHGTGDAVLRTLARRLRRTVRPTDLVGRVGGDELCVLVPAPGPSSELVGLAVRVLDAVQVPVPVGDREIRVSASVGATMSRPGDGDAERLLREAEAAAAQARQEGRGRVVAFDDALRADMDERVELEGAIRAGLAAGEFTLHYQAIVDARSGRVGGYEALARWERPGYGLVPPSGFIPTAEQSALICDLGRWCVREATRQAAAWRRERPADSRDVRVAVNISGRHLTTPGIVSEVAQALADADLPPRLLVLEITETVLVDRPAARTQMAALRALGVAVSIDDFGTGYTSIGQLQHLPASTLKIDRSLVASTAPGSRELVALVVHAAHAFGLTVVAEGVETPEQLATVRDLGCDRVQGFLFARPVPAADVSVVAVAR